LARACHTSQIKFSRQMPPTLAQKEPLAWKATRKGKLDVSGMPKETAISREIMPADGNNNAKRN